MSEEKELPKVGEWWWYESLTGEAWKCKVLGISGSTAVLLCRGDEIVREANRLVCKCDEPQKPWWRFWA